MERHGISAGVQAADQQVPFYTMAMHEMNAAVSNCIFRPKVILNKQKSVFHCVRWEGGGLKGRLQSRHNGNKIMKMACFCDGDKNENNPG